MKVVKNSFIYLGSSFFSKAIPFLMLPILTKYLSPEDYGVLSIFTIFTTIYIAFIGMSMGNNISRNFFKLSKSRLSLIIGNIVYILIFNTLLFLTISYIIWLLYESFFSIPSWLLLLVPVLSFMQMFNVLNLTILRNEQRAFVFGLFEIMLVIVTVSLTLLFLVFYECGWISQVYAVFIASFLFFIVGFVYMSKRGYLKFIFSQKRIKSIVKTSAPFVPHSLGGLIIVASDRLFIEKMIGLEATGLYAIGYSFGAIVIIFSDAFIKAWSPWFYEQLTFITKEKKLSIVKYTYMYIVGIFILATVVSVAAKLILPYMVDSRYLDADKFIVWIALNYAIRGVYQIFFPYLVYLNKTEFLAISTAVSAILNLIFNYFFIKSFGAVGATYATIVAFAASAFMVYWYQKKNYYMPWLLRNKNEE